MLKPAGHVVKTGEEELLFGVMMDQSRGKRPRDRQYRAQHSNFEVTLTE